MNWQPIKTVPKTLEDGLHVDLWSAWSGTRKTDAHWTGEKWVKWGFNSLNDAPGWEEIYQPSHWMPVPNSPETA